MYVILSKGNEKLFYVYLVWYFFRFIIIFFYNKYYSGMFLVILVFSI